MNECESRAEQGQTAAENPKCLLLMESLRKKAIEVNHRFRAASPKGKKVTAKVATALRARWHEIVRRDGVAAINAFTQWEARQLARFDITHSTSLLQEVRNLLSRDGAANVFGLLAEDGKSRAEAFDAASSSEAEMAAAACSVWWRGEFSGLLLNGLRMPTADWFFRTSVWPQRVDLPVTMWNVAEREPTRDPTTFAADVYEGVIAAASADHVTFSFFNKPLDQRFAAVRGPEDMHPTWLREAMLGGVAAAQDRRAGLLVLLWASDVGLLPRVWPAIAREKARAEKRVAEMDRMFSEGEATGSEQ